MAKIAECHPNTSRFSINGGRGCVIAYCKAHRRYRFFWHLIYESIYN